jgi:hypothetical protein
MVRDLDHALLDLDPHARVGAAMDVEARADDADQGVPGLDRERLAVLVGDHEKASPRSSDNARGRQREAARSREAGARVTWLPSLSATCRLWPGRVS